MTSEQLTTIVLGLMLLLGHLLNYLKSVEISKNVKQVKAVLTEDTTTD